MDTRFKNTDFFIEDIDESVKDLTVNDTSVSHFPANTDFFIENIDNNVIEICTDRGITPSTVSVVPANTDFFIVNIDTNVKKIATDLSITPSSVSKSPANTDFFIENIYFNVILICEELNIEPYEITATPTNTDFFIEAIAKNVEKIMEEQTEIHVSGTFIHAVLSADSEISDYELDGNATQDGTPTPDSPQPINTVTGEQTLTVTGENQSNSLEINLGKNLFDVLVGTHTSGGLDWNVTPTTISVSGIASSGNSQSQYMTLDAPLHAGTYTFSIPQTLAYYALLQVIDTSGTDHTICTIRAGNLSATATTTYDITKIRLRLGGWTSGDSVDISLPNEVQFEKGSQATTYAPYFTPIELAKIGTYQDKIYKDESKWYIEKQVGKVVLTGADTEGWNTATNSPYYAFYTTVLASLGFVDKICDNFTYENISWRNATTPILCENSTPTKLLIFAGFTDITNVTAWNTWLSTHPTTVYYALATPTTTEITDDTLLAQLNAIYDIELKEGVINISITATSPNLPASLKATIIPKE